MWFSVVCLRIIKVYTCKRKHDVIKSTKWLKLGKVGKTKCWQFHPLGRCVWCRRFVGYWLTVAMVQVVEAGYRCAVVHEEKTRTVQCFNRPRRAGQARVRIDGCLDPINYGLWVEPLSLSDLCSFLPRQWHGSNPKRRKKIACVVWMTMGSIEPPEIGYHTYIVFNCMMHLPY